MWLECGRTILKDGDYFHEYMCSKCLKTIVVLPKDKPKECGCKKGKKANED